MAHCISNDTAVNFIFPRFHVLQVEISDSELVQFVPVQQGYICSLCMMLIVMSKA